MDISEECDRRLLKSIFPPTEDDFGNSIANEPRNAVSPTVLLSENSNNFKSNNIIGAHFDSSTSEHCSDERMTKNDSGYHSSPKTSQPRSCAPNSELESLPMHAGCQTGPKGVLADYRWMYHCKNKFNENRCFTKQSSPLKNLITRDPNNPTQHDSVCDIAELGETVGNLEDLEIDFDKDFFENYRRRRLLEMSESSKRPIHNAYREIGSSQFLKEIDCSHPQTPVIVHLFDANVKECRLLDSNLIRLAAKYGYAKFLRMSVSRGTEFSLDSIALPILQLYKAQHLILNNLRVGDEIRRCCSQSSSKEFDWDFRSCEEFLLISGFLHEEDEFSENKGKSARLLSTVNENDEESCSD